MTFDALHPLSKEYIETMCGNVEAGTHTVKVLRLSGSINDARARLVQKSAGSADDITIYLEGYSSGDAFQRLIARGFIKGAWVDPDVWEGTIDDSALAEYRGE